MQFLIQFVWDVTQCRLVNITDLSKAHDAFIVNFVSSCLESVGLHVNLLKYSHLFSVITFHLQMRYIIIIIVIIIIIIIIMFSCANKSVLKSSYILQLIRAPHSYPDVTNSWTSANLRASVRASDWCVSTVWRSEERCSRHYRGQSPDHRLRVPRLVAHD